MKISSGWFSFILAFTLAASVLGEDAKVETIVAGLKNPCGVAVQPDSGALFVSESGAGRIVRVDDGKLIEIVRGSPLDTYGKGPTYKIGPLGILFLDKKTLVVADGGYPDGEEFVRVFQLPEDADQTLDYEEDARAKMGPLDAADGQKPEGNFYGLAANKAAIYVTSNGDDGEGWIASSEINGTKFGGLERTIATKREVDVDAPVGITLSPRGEIVVGQMGEIDRPRDSLLSFYSAKTHKLLLNLETGLHDITGLAFSPKTGLLYATDFAWTAPNEGGVYRLDSQITAGRQAIKAVKIASLARPTAIAFDKEGSAYITVIGNPQGDDDAAGSLVKISGL
jgi:DNA-binding beta-propeller fold protein YncE